MPSVVDLQYQQAQQNQVGQVLGLAEAMAAQRENLRRYQQERTDRIMRDTLDFYQRSQEMAQQNEQFQQELGDRKEAREQQNEQFEQGVELEREQFEYSREQDEKSRQLRERQVGIAEQQEQRIGQAQQFDMDRIGRQQQAAARLLQIGMEEGWIADEGQAQMLMAQVQSGDQDLIRNAFEILEKQRVEAQKQNTKDQLLASQTEMLASYGQRMIQNSRLSAQDMDDAMAALSMGVPFQKVVQQVFDAAQPDTQSVRIGGKMHDIPVRVMSDGLPFEVSTPEVREFWLDLANQTLLIEDNAAPEVREEMTARHAMMLAAIYGGWKIESLPKVGGNGFGSGIKAHLREYNERVAEAKRGIQNGEAETETRRRHPETGKWWVYDAKTGKWRPE